MSKILKKKEYLIVVLVIVLFMVTSIMSISSIKLLQGNARVVNYVGIVRGATQKLIKEEIMEYPDDKLVVRLDSIVSELITGEGPNDLIVLDDQAYLANMMKVQDHWELLKKQIMQVRGGEDPKELFDSSQMYFELVNDTVFSAEEYSEKQVHRINMTLIVINGVFILLIIFALVIYIRGLASKRRADALGQIAYIDPLTQLDNRASCERLTARLQESLGGTCLAVCMIDMNDLKLTNDFLGHKGGDMILNAFAKALKTAASENTFVGRYGGDEFLIVMENENEQSMKEYLERVRENVYQYNEKQTNSLEMIHYATGYTVADINKIDIEDMIHEADNKMYENKRRLKE